MEVFLGIYLLILHILSASGIENAKILAIGKEKKVFSLNIGLDHSIKERDSASFYYRIDNVDKDAQYIGKALAIKVYPHTSIWKIQFWPRKEYLVKNNVISIFHIVDYEKNKGEAKISRNLYVLKKTQEKLFKDWEKSQLIQTEKNVPERSGESISIARLEKTPIKYRDENGKDLSAVYIKNIQQGKSQKEIMDELVQKEKASLLQSHLNKIKGDKNKISLEQINDTKRLNWSDEFSDESLRRIIQRKSETKELLRRNKFSKEWIKTQLDFNYLLATSRQNQDRGSGINIGIEFPLAILDLRAISWSLNIDYRAFEDQYAIQQANNLNNYIVKEKSLKIGVSYYLINNPHLIRRFNVNVGMGIRFGGSFLQNIQRPSSNTYSVLGFPHFWSSLKYRLFKNIGMMINIQYERLLFSLQEKRYEVGMPENFYLSQFQVGGGLCVYF